MWVEGRGDSDVKVKSRFYLLVNRQPSMVLMIMDNKWKVVF